MRRCDAGTLELGGGLEVLLTAVLESCQVGEEFEVLTSSRAAALELPGWARIQGHPVVGERREDSRGGHRWVIRLRRSALRRILAPALPEATLASAAAVR